jgi:hypothetical protein
MERPAGGQRHLRGALRSNPHWGGAYPCESPGADLDQLAAWLVAVLTGVMPCASLAMAVAPSGVITIVDLLRARCHAP